MLRLPQNKHEISISSMSMVSFIALILGLVFLYSIKSILILVFLAFILMVALNPIVTTLESRLRVPRIGGILLAYLFLIIVIVGLFGFLVPPLVRELYQLIKTLNLPVLNDIQSQVTNFRLDIEEIGSLADRIGGSVGTLFSVVTSTFSGVFTFFTLLVVSFYLMQERPYLHHKMVWFTKKPERIAEVKKFLDDIELQLGGWVRGQLILMFTIGLITYIGLALLGVPYALPLALLAGLLEILPNLGPTIAALPAIFVTYLLMGPVAAGFVILFYVVVQQLENNLIVPKVMKANADVNPLVAIITILIGLQLGGVMGALLAVPTYIVVRTWYGIWVRPKMYSA